VQLASFNSFPVAAAEITSVWERAAVQQFSFNSFPVAARPSAWRGSGLGRRLSILSQLLRKRGPPSNCSL